VGDMEDYDQLHRAVAYFTHKYGRIHFIESLNEHWLESEARLVRILTLREDTGPLRCPFTRESLE